MIQATFRPEGGLFLLIPSTLRSLAAMQQGSGFVGDAVLAAGTTGVAALTIGKDGK